MAERQSFIVASANVEVSRGIRPIYNVEVDLRIPLHSYTSILGYLYIDMYVGCWGQEGWLMSASSLKFTVCCFVHM